MNSDYKDTAAYKIIRQVTDHTWGSDQKINEENFVKLYHNFINSGGSWERLMDGDMSCVKILEDAIDGFMEARKLSKVASKISKLSYPR